MAEVNGNNGNGSKPTKRLKNGCDPYEIGKSTFIKPGEVRNPTGRPKRKLIDEVLTELLEMSESKDAKAIAKALITRAKKDYRAAQLVAERTQGKPRQHVEMELEISGSVSILTDEALAERASELTQMVARVKSA